VKAEKKHSKEFGIFLFHLKNTNFDSHQQEKIHFTLFLHQIFLKEFFILEVTSQNQYFSHHLKTHTNESQKTRVIFT
jgi:hypothetical protein